MILLHGIAKREVKERIMIRSSCFRDNINSLFHSQEFGIVTLVDELIELSLDHGLRIRLLNGHCLAEQLMTTDKDLVEIPLPKSAFRAVLARIATICNDQHPQSVTPYRGQVKIDWRSQSGSTTVCQLEFVNTATEQQLEIRPED